MGEQAIQAFVDQYFNSPEPQRAPEVLRAFLQSPAGQDPGQATWYLFARIAQDHPFLVREYEKLFREAHTGRTVLLLILWQAGDDQTKALLESCLAEPDFALVRNEIEQAVQKWGPGSIRPLTRPVESLADLDLLWCEFRATGNLEAVVRLIDVLERPDIVRSKLEAWLRESPPVLVRDVRKRLFREASILCDAESGEVLSSQDLDSFCLMEELNISKRQFEKLSGLLPFSISDGAIMIKASAKWSLASHAKQYAQIRDLCKSEVEKRSGRCRLTLLETLALLSGSDDLESAFHYHGESLQTSVTNQERLNATADWKHLEGLTPETAVVDQVQSVPRDAPTRCALAIREARSYLTRRLDLRGGRESPGLGDSMCDAEFARPARFHVFQTMWWKSGKVYDEWLTFPQAHYRGPAYLPGGPTEKHDRKQNQRLTADPYLRILRSKPTRTEVHRWNGSSYLFFEYRRAPLPSAPLWFRIAQALGLPLFRCHLFMWADYESGRVKKVICKAGRDKAPPERRYQIIHMFTGYDEPVFIAPPPFNIIKGR